MRILLFLLLSISCSSFGQVKILFDASKGQMLGNADWVIDADQHNLGYDNTGAMVVGQGNEANPQRLPTPAQSGITQSTSETYWTGSLSAWGIDMVKQGYEVESLPYNGSITYKNNSNPQDLSNYKVFICDEPNMVFTSAERDAIVQWVYDGGGLFMISDHDQSDRNFDGWDSPHIWNDLMANNSVQSNPFGMTFDYQNFSETNTNVATYPNDSCLHGPIGSVTSIKYSNGTSMTLNHSNNSSVRGLIYKTGSSTTGNTNALVATCWFGKGKVAALGDSSPPDDGTGDPNDNLYMSYTGEVNGNHRKLLVNTTIWLAATSTVSGIENAGSTDNEIKLYPNPAQHNLNVRLVNDEKGVLEIRDVAGKVISTQEFSTSQFNCDISRLANGIYFATFLTEGKTITRKFSVQQ